MWKQIALSLAVASLVLADDAVRLAAPASPGVQTAHIYFPFGDKPIGRWTGAALVGWDRPAPAIYAFDKQGQQVGNITVRVPQASEIRIYRAIRAPDGSYAAVGIAYVSSGAAAFIWRISADGLQQNAIATAPYIADDIAISSDGMLWTAGVQKQTTRLSYEDYADEHDIIRRFTPDGRPAGSWLRWQKAKGRAHPASRGSFLFAATNRVGWYPAGGDEYIEFSLDGQITGRYPTAPMIAGQQFTGVALCDDGRVFAGRETHNARGAAEKWEIVTLDRQQHTWQPVSGTPQGQWGWIYGCDGNRLVTYTRGGNGLQELDFWLPGPAR